MWGERGYSGEGGRLGVGGGLVSREGKIVGLGWGRVVEWEWDGVEWEWEVVEWEWEGV